MGNAELIQTARKLRVEILTMVDRAKAGHVGGSLSIIDTLVALYYGGVLTHDPKKPKDVKRDYLFLSKAHASPAMYAVLAHRGFFPKKELEGFRQIDSLLQGHVTSHVPGIDLSGGSLGQGLSAATGAAMGLQMDTKGNHVFCILGDGELQEGQNWEAAQTAAKYKLGNLTAIVDVNGLQIDGSTEEVMPMGDIAAKFVAFGWEAVAVDGHDMEALVRVLGEAKESRTIPRVIVAKTVKGKGAPAAENNYRYHGTPLTPEHLAEAMEALTK